MIFLKLERTVYCWVVLFRPAPENGTTASVGFTQCFATRGNLSPCLRGVGIQVDAIFYGDTGFTQRPRSVRWVRTCVCVCENV